MRGADLSVEHVSKHFGGVTAVDDVSFSVATGEALAVIGPNGAGKSSLLKLLSGVYTPDSGTVVLDGARIDGRTPEAVARLGVSLAHQVPRPFRGWMWYVVQSAAPCPPPLTLAIRERCAVKMLRCALHERTK